MKDEIKDIAKKVKIIIKVGKIAATAATVAMVIYTLIPKYEKIEGINTEVLIAQNVQEQ